MTASDWKRLMWSCAVAFGIGFGWQASEAAAFGTCCFTETCRCTSECGGDCQAYYCDSGSCDAAIHDGRCYLCDN